MSTSTTQISCVREDDVARIELVPVEGKPPTLDETVLDRLEAHLAVLSSDPPRATIVSSASAKYFCVGANVAALERLSRATMADWIARGHAVFNRLEDLPCPTLAVVRGYALGGGLELALACDVICCDTSARMGLTEASLGFVPGWGGTLRLAERIGHAAAKRCFFAGVMLDAHEAHRLGLADRVCDDAELDAQTSAWVAAVAERSPEALTRFKRILHADRDTARRSALRAESDHSLQLVEHPDTRQRVQGFLTSRK